jgi:hypothetical protein
MEKQPSKGVAAKLSSAAKEAVRRVMGGKKAAPEKAEMAKDAPKAEEKPH